MKSINDESINVHEDYNKIGGWLILVIVGYIITIFSAVKTVVKGYNLYLDGTMPKLIDSKSEYYNPFVYNLTNFDLVIKVVLVIAVILAILFMFSKKSFYPRYAIGLIVAVNIINLSRILYLNYNGIAVSSENIIRVIGSFCRAGVWITYFIKSKRVKYTFIK